KFSENVAFFGFTNIYNIYVILRFLGTSEYLYLQHIDLSFCTSINDKSLEFLCKTCVFIRNLYLRRCRQITDIGVLYIAKYCAHLRELSLCQCVKVSDTGISLAECPLVSDCSLIYLSKVGFFHQIRYLNLRGCAKVSDKFTKYLVGASVIVRFIQSEFMLASLSRMQQKFFIPFELKTIDLSKCSISDKSIEYLCRLVSVKPDLLHRISLRCCDGITDSGIRLLAANCRNLQSLNVTKCANVSSQSLKEIKKNCPSCFFFHFLSLINRPCHERLINTSFI
ncbi:F-box LRR-repeat 7, partial [Brachionus plicatilis]